jgi:thioredoxin-dependent peroxiredoxin
MAKKPAKTSAKKPLKKAVKKPAKKATKKAVKKAAPKAAKKPVKKAALKKKVAVKKASKPAVKKAVVKKPLKKAAPAKPAAKAPKPKPTTKFTAHQTRLKAGDKAPYFEGRDQSGNTVSSESLKGKTIVLYFYPKDDTPGCTAEACSLRDEYQYLSKANFAVVGVSADDEKSHAKFAAKYSLPFPLLADTAMNVIKAYDVFGKKQFMGKIYDGIIRTTFVIDGSGVIKHVVTDVNTKEHAKQVLSL